MTHFSGHNTATMKRLVFLLFISIIIFNKSLAEAREKLELPSELSSNREEFVDWAGYGEEKLSTVIISGKLLCHVHKTSHHPHPISGASVGIFCSKNGKMKKPWANGKTNSYGEFLIDLPSHLHAIPNLEKICLVKVFHLPKGSPCNHGFTGKHKGIKLISAGEGIRVYSTQNVHLMPKPTQTHRKRGNKRANTVSI